MMVGSLADAVAEKILDGVIDGSLAPGSLLPPEAELAAIHGVSRLTVREAIRSLRTNNVVTIRRGLGTEVNPPELWTSLESIVRSFGGGRHEAAAEQVLEARRMIEIGAAQLAAERRTDEELVALQQHVDDLRAAHAADDLPGVVASDIRFHDGVAAAGKNMFIPLLFAAFGPLLVAPRRQTFMVRQIQINAIAHHTVILATLRASDPEAARLAMTAHMDQTLHDLRHYVAGLE